jgi:electron transport complex protein RnfG
MSDNILEAQKTAPAEEAAPATSEAPADAALQVADDKVHLHVVPAAAELTKPPTGNVLGQAWLVLLLAIVFGAGLATIERVLGPVIAQNRLTETLEQVPELVPGSARGEADDTTIAGRRVFRALDAQGKLVGWVIPGKGQGFADKIEIVVGVDAQAKTITGLAVLDQKETPALGDKITTAEFRGLFAGVSTDVALGAKRAPTDKATGRIQALTGATISSEAVCAIVNKTVGAVKAPLAAAATSALAN